MQWPSHLNFYSACVIRPTLVTISDDASDGILNAFAPFSPHAQSCVRALIAAASAVSLAHWARANKQACCLMKLDMSATVSYHTAVHKSGSHRHESEEDSSYAAQQTTSGGGQCVTRPHHASQLETVPSLGSSRADNESPMQ